VSVKSQVFLPGVISTVSSIWVLYGTETYLFGCINLDWLDRVGAVADCHFAVGFASGRGCT